MPKYSIEISHYKEPDRLVRAVSSCFCQGLDDYHIYIRDDCSSDFETMRILDILDRDPKITVDVNERNLGAATTRNLLWNRSTEFHFILDCDDLMHPSRMKEQVGTLNANKQLISRDSLTVCSSNYRVFTQSGRSDEVCLDSKTDVYASLYILQPFAFSGTLIKTEIQNPFQDGLRSCIDYDFLTRYYEKLKHIHINKTLTYVEHVSKSLTRDHHTRSLQLDQHDKCIQRMWSRIIPTSIEDSRLIRRAVVTSELMSEQELIKLLNIYHRSTSIDHGDEKFKSVVSYLGKYISKNIGLVL